MNHRLFDEDTSEDVEDVIEKQTNASVHELYTWIDDANNAFVTKKGDPKTIIIDQKKCKNYVIPLALIPKFMKYYEFAYKNGCSTLGFSERQSTDDFPYAGLAFDFDMIIKTDTFDMSKEYTKFATTICSMVYRHLKISELDVMAFFIVRPKTTRKDNGYKTGFHMIIPGIQTTRSYKKYLMKELSTNKKLVKVLSGMNLVTPEEECLDRAYASNPVLFLGSAKREGLVYQLKYALRVTIDDLDDLSADTEQVPLDSIKDYNLPWELSLNFQAEYPNKDPLVKKQVFKPRDDIELRVKEYAERTQGNILKDDDLNAVDNDVNLITTTDIIAKQIKMYLDILDPPAYENRNEWLKIIFAVANSAPYNAENNYLPLLKAFSQRCPFKFSEIELLRLWEDAVAKRYTNSVKNPVTISSLKYIARTSNPSKFDKVLEKDVFTLLLKNVYKLNGDIGHYHIAKVMHIILGENYACCYDSGANRSGNVWYEFMAPGVPMSKGEVWKWKSHDQPDRLFMFMSDGLAPIIDNVFEDVKTRKNNATTPEQIKYYQNVMTTFHRKVRAGLYMTNFKSGVITECTRLFRQGREDFLKSMDSDGSLFGVGNGIIKLGKKIEFIDHYHEHKVSRFTPVRYKPFNPNNQATKDMLDYFKSIIPELDARFRIVMGFAACLDGWPKDPELSIFSAGGSNGKTTLMLMICKVFGSMYGNNASADILTSDPPSPDKPNSGVAMFERKRFLYMEESTNGGALNANTVKRLVSPGEISVRDLHKTQKNFQNTWKIFLATNFPPAMDCKDYALIRRIIFYYFKVKFVHEPQLPHERKCNPKVASEWPENEEYLEALLSILIYFYEMLMTDYGGNIKNVKSPTIERETQEYFNRNDYVSKFITKMVVESPTQYESIPISQVVIVYKMWLSSVEGIDKQMHHDTDTIQREFCDHPIVQKKFLMKDKDGSTGSLIRCRILSKDRMTLEEGESYVSIFDDIDHTPPQLEEEPDDWWVPTHRRNAKPVSIPTMSSKKEDNIWPNDDIEIMKVERKESLKVVQDELDDLLGL